MSAEPWHALIAAERLPESYAKIVERWWIPMAEHIADSARARRQKPLFVGVSGAQGSGKSTVCRFLAELLSERGLRCVTLSLDDFYLTHAQRQALAETVHPLLATRGVPGTHDVRLMEQAFDAFQQRESEFIRLPRFDKAQDDRAAPDSWHQTATDADIVLFEGWCVGAEAQDHDALSRPINALERLEDADGRWREYVNAALAGPYAALFGRLDLLVALLPPDFASVRANRALQESKLAAGDGPDRRMDSAALDRFLAHYERITLALMDSLPQRADIVVRLGPGQEILSLTAKD